MQPKSYMLPNISIVHPDYSLVDVRNQYSILNRIKSRDVLGSFSYDMEWKLPRINQRVRYLDEKENQLTDMENRLYVQNKYLQEFQNMLGCHCQCFGHKCNHDNHSDSPKEQPKPQPQPQKQQPSKKAMSNSAQNFKKNNERRNKILKKFRKCVYAVYFCIYLKHFSSKFTKNRYNFFKDRYLINDGEKVKQDSYKITKSIQAINLLPLILQAPENMDKISKLRIDSSKVISTKLTAKLIPENYNQKFVKAINFVNLYVKQLQQIILSKKFVDYYAEIIGIGTINQSFFMDELMIPQQIQFITFSQKKGFAQISQQTQKTLVMTYVFAKHVLFKILLKLRDKKYLQTNLINDFGKYRGEMEKIYEFLQLANSILYTLVNSVFLEFIDENSQLHTNYDTLKKRFKITPAKVLTAPNCPKQIKETVNYRELILAVPKANEAEQFLQEFMYRQYVNYLMSQIAGVSQRLLNQVRYVNKAVYEHIKEETIKQKYLIFQGMKNEEVQQKGNGKTMRSNRDMYMNETKGNNTNSQSKANTGSIGTSKTPKAGNMMKSIRQFNNNNDKLNKSQSNVNLNNTLNNKAMLYSRMSNTSLGNQIFTKSKN